MIEKKVVVEDIMGGDIYSRVKELEKEYSTQDLEGVRVATVTVERVFDKGGFLKSEEVTFWVSIDEDIYDTEYNPMSNEVTIKIPMERVLGLDEISHRVIQELIQFKNKLIK